MSSEALERCLACEAEVSKGRSVAHPISVSALCLDFRGVTRKEAWRPLGLASEAALHELGSSSLPKGLLSPLSPLTASTSQIAFVAQLTPRP
jgi:hypothetical protein